MLMWFPSACLPKHILGWFCKYLLGSSGTQPNNGNQFVIVPCHLSYINIKDILSRADVIYKISHREL